MKTMGTETRPSRAGEAREPGGATTSMRLSISFVIPLYNEVENVDPLVAEVRAVMDESERECEVLLIDDGIMRQTIVRAMLESCGYSVYRSRNDECAIEDYLLAKDAGYPFDCIVMDLYVSYGIGGKETIRKLIEADRECQA